jgi:hypothetical protein
MKMVLTLAIILVANTGYSETPQVPITIRNIAYGGNGCPQNSVGINLSSNKQAFTMIMDEYIAEIGPGVARRENRKSCQVSLDLKVPSGWQYSVATFDFRGFASLEKDVKGLQKTTFYFQGQSNTGSFETPIDGPTERNFQLRDTISVESSVWSPCGETRALQIHSEVRLSTRNSSKEGILTVDSIDGAIKQVYGIAWRRC